MGLSEKLINLKEQGCYPHLCYRGNGIWRAHINGAGNYWNEASTPEAALYGAIADWSLKGKPMDGYAATNDSVASAGASSDGFKLGDVVKWTSQSASYWKAKQGTIVAVVPANGRPESHIPMGMRCGSSAGFGAPRRHESYLIQVGKSSWLYWPLVKNLSKA